MVNLTSGSVSARAISLEETRCPCLSSTTTDRRQRFAAPGSPVPHRHNDAPAIGAAGIYRRRQAEGLGVSLPVQRLDAMQTMDLQLQLHRLPGLQIPGRRGQIDRQIFALTILHHRQIIPLRTIEAAPAQQRAADRHLVCRKLLL